MSEIKFKVWHKETKEFINFDNVAISLQGDVWDTTNKHFIDITNDVEITQYTGLKDKNGVEVYSRDIIRVADEYNILIEIVYEALEVIGADLPVEDIKDFDYNYTVEEFNSLLMFSSFEVIRNEFENIEILNGQRRNRE